MQIKLVEQPLLALTFSGFCDVAKRLVEFRCTEGFKWKISQIPLHRPCRAWGLQMASKCNAKMGQGQLPLYAHGIARAAESGPERLERAWRRGFAAVLGADRLSSSSSLCSAWEEAARPLAVGAGGAGWAAPGQPCAELLPRLPLVLVTLLRGNAGLLLPIPGPVTRAASNGLSCPCHIPVD